MEDVMNFPETLMEEKDEGEEEDDVILTGSLHPIKKIKHCHPLDEEEPSRREAEYESIFD
jgi:hypothetical protein